MAGQRTYHVPALLGPTLDGLNIQPDGVYVDATFGGGGHARAILDRLGPKGRLLAFDQDPEAQENVPEDSRLTFVAANFRHLHRFLKLHGVSEVDGVLADLGVSFHQFDEAERGFSYRFDGPLDMRMNPSMETTAADILNHYQVEQLQRVLSEYGELRNARTVAQVVVRHRQNSPFVRIQDLLGVLGPLIRGQRVRYLSQLFQALRMEVNDEMGALQAFLEQATEALRPGGRLVVLSYHSIEDRVVKHFFKSGNFSGKQEKDFYGRLIRPLKPLTRKPIVPDAKEIEENSRARSAKLRIAEKKQALE